MDIIYDPAKNRENIKKHGIDFADLTPVFYDDRTLGPIEDNDHAESRFVVIGLDALMRIVVVVYAYGEDDTLRIISSRLAKPHEIRQFQR